MEEIESSAHFIHMMDGKAGLELLSNLRPLDSICPIPGANKYPKQQRYLGELDMQSVLPLQLSKLLKFIYIQDMSSSQSIHMSYMYYTYLRLRP